MSDEIICMQCNKQIDKEFYYFYFFGMHMTGCKECVLAAEEAGRMKNNAAKN